jgi:hypothetical protein
MYDILITVAEKDFNKLRFVIKSIYTNLEGFKDIIVIANTTLPYRYRISSIKYLTDNDMFYVDPALFEGYAIKRRGWYIQQFIKLFQQVTSDEYLVVDADVYFNRKVEVIKDGIPVFLLGKEQYHKPYFMYTDMMFGFDRVYPYSFINEVMYFKREYIEHMVASKEMKTSDFIKDSINIINFINHPTSSFSEYETYGNYVTKYFPNAYTYQYIKTHSVGVKRIWEEFEVHRFINKFEGQDYDKLALHTWL